VNEEIIKNGHLHQASVCCVCHFIHLTSCSISESTRSFYHLFFFFTIILEINHSKFFFEIELYIRKTICTSPFSVLPGFISLDCGLASNESPYNEANSNLTYISDADFIQGGKTGNVQKDLLMKLRKPYTVLRYFPDGIRNCYSLNVKQDTNYLIRVMFRYGNYDGLNNSPRFDLYLGPNIWTTIDMGKSGDGVLEEIIHITRSNILDICLVKTGTSTPMISSIELRPLLYDTYIAQTGSLRNYNRFYFTDSNNYIRYLIFTLCFINNQSRL